MSQKRVDGEGDGLTKPEKDPKKYPERDYFCLEVPFNSDAEKTILGAIFLDPEKFNLAKMDLEDFYLSNHRLVYRAVVELMEMGSAVDIVTVVEHMRSKKTLFELGETPMAFIASLTEGLPMRPMIRDYVRIVKEKARLRRIIFACDEAIEAAKDQSDKSEAITGKLWKALEGMAYAE